MPEPCSDPNYCTTSTCSEYGIAKANPACFPVEEIACGQCGGPVSPSDPTPES